MALIDKASLLMVPSTYEAGKLYNVLPSGNRAPDSTGENSGYDQTRADFDFDRGSNAAATRIGSDGLIKKYRENLALNSNNFQSWSQTTAATTTSGQEDKDGGTDAWLVTKSAANGSVRELYTFDGLVKTFSVYAKAGTTNWMELFAGGNRTFFDLENGVIGTSSGSVIDSNIEAVGTDGWYRCSIVQNYNGASTLRIYVSNADGDNSGTTGSIYIQDAQLESGLVATEYLNSTSVTGKAGVLIDLPRIDYSSGAGALLLEPSRQQLVPFSEYLGASDWGKTRCTIEDNSTTSPEGLINSAKMTSTDANESYIQDIFSFTGSTISWSFFAKKGDLDYCHGLVWDLLANGCRQWFNLNDGTVGGSTTFGSGYSVSSATIEDYGSGWYRCTMIISGSSGSNGCRVSLSSANTTITSAVNSYGYFYGLQGEDASYPTSYIPNHGESGGVTRAADSFSVDSISEHINSVEGTIYLEAEALHDDNTYRGVSINDGSFTNMAQVRFSNTSNQITAQYKTGGSNACLISEVVTDTTQRQKIAFRYKTNDFKMYVNGVDAGSDTSGATNSANTFDEIDSHRGDSGDNFYGRIYKYILFNEGLSNSELESLTS